MTNRAGPGAGATKTSRRGWRLAGLAALVIGCLAVCSVGAFALYRASAGDPPGQGARAEAGYAAAAPVIAALDKYHQAHGSYPATLAALAPDELSALPGEVNGYPLGYQAKAGSYSLDFSYAGPGMNHCTYTPETQWKCYGFY